MEIFLDTQPAIIVPFSVDNISNLVGECNNSPKEIGTKTFPSMGFRSLGDEAADEQARRGSSYNADMQCVLESSLRVVYNEIGRHFHREANTNLMDLTSCWIFGVDTMIGGPSSSWS